MKKMLLFVTWLSMTASFVKAQFQLIPSGTSVNHLIYISAFGNDIFIGGDSGYCARSYNECKSLNVIRSKYDHIYTTRWQRISPNVICEAHRYNEPDPGGINGWKHYNAFWVSDDGGVTKKNRYAGYTTRFYNLCMWDTTAGYCVSLGCENTHDGGRTWNPGGFTSNYTSIISLSKPFSDSVLFSCGGSKIDFTSDRGATFTRRNMSFTINALANVGTDTVFAANTKGFAYTLNRGQTWDSTFAGAWQGGTFKANNLYFKSKNLGFSLGLNNDGEAVIGKTTTLGQSWLWVNTGIKRKLYDMAVINDSIAILVGELGTIIRWNYRNTQFVTGIKENIGALSGFKMGPNPASTDLNYSFNLQHTEILKLSLFDLSGRELQSIIKPASNGSIDVSELKEGVYFVKVYLNNQGIETNKIILLRD